MNVVLCALEELTDWNHTLRSLPDDLTEAEAAEIVARVHRTFRAWLDERPVQQVFSLSVRALNVMQRHGAVTISDLCRLLAKARSSTKVPGAGRMVMSEWEAAIRAAARTTPTP